MSSRHHLPCRMRAVAVIAGSALLAASCGGGSSEPEVLAAQSSDDTTSAGGASTSVAGGLQAEANPGSTTTEAPPRSTTTADGMRSEANSPTETPTSGGADSQSDPDTVDPQQPKISLPDGSEEFADPEGDWLMSIGPEWAPSHGLVQDEVELWFLPGSGVEFADNISVLTQQNVFSTDLEGYLDLSVGSGTAVLEDFELIDDRFLIGPYGQKQGILEYTGTAEGYNVHFFQVVVLNDDIAVVATLAATDDRFDDRVAEVEDFLRTLRLS